MRRLDDINTDRWLAILALLLVAVWAMVSLTGCGEARITTVKPSTADEQLKKAVHDKAVAEEKATAAIKTSQDATAAAQEARREATAARALADEKNAQAKALESQANDLRKQEIANRISSYAWWLVGAGGLAIVAGFFLFVYMPGKLAMTVLISGVGTLALGLLGLWLAPWWIAIAWCTGAVVAVSAIGAMVYAIHEHSHGLATLWDKTQEEAKADPRLAKLLKKAGIVP